MCTNTQLYYAGIDASQLGPVGLKTALHDLIDGHTVLSYTPEVWTALTMLDRSPTDSSRVRLLYSDHTHHATDNRGQMSTWNREHAWPQSYGVSDSGPDNADVHHIFASDYRPRSSSTRSSPICTSAATSSPARYRPSSSSTRSSPCCPSAAIRSPAPSLPRWAASRSSPICTSSTISSAARFPPSST